MSPRRSQEPSPPPSPGREWWAHVCSATHLACPLPRSAFWESSPSWQCDPAPKKGKPPSTILRPSPLPSKLGVGIAYCHFHVLQKLKHRCLLTFFHGDFCLDVSGTFPMYQFEIGFGCQDLLLYPRWLMAANATKPRLMVVSSAVWHLWMVPFASTSRVGGLKMFLHKE